MVKEFLSQKGISFQERDVSINQSYAQELVKSTGQMGVPVTVINGQTVVGFDRGRLEQLLTKTQTSQRPPFGASIADASKITAKQGSGIILGAYIGSVRPGSVAERIGLELRGFELLISQVIFHSEFKYNIFHSGIGTAH